MTYPYLALTVPEPSGWVSVVISAFAVILALCSFALTLWRGRKRMRIRSSLEFSTDHPDEYRCQVTNTGFVGLQIARVELRVRGPGLRGRFNKPRTIEGGPIVLWLYGKAEQHRKLDPGESQRWGMYLEDIQASLEEWLAPTDDDERREARREVQVIAVAADTTGKEYRQKTKDAVTIPSWRTSLHGR